MKAVELLERGQCLFWNQISRLRSPLADIVASGPTGEKLAGEFARLTSQIRAAITSPASGAGQHDLICRLNLDLHRVVMGIRELPGLEHFLLPSPFSILRGAAHDGPVIIVNASKYTCDALVVFVDQDPVHIPLEITKARTQELSSEFQSLVMDAKKMDITRDLGFILRELWSLVVSPIVDFLQTTLRARSRIWWCPTTEFTLLPLHAAGPYRPGQPNLSDLYISSYAITLSALIHARCHSPSSSVVDAKHVVAIGLRDVSEESELRAVSTELDIVAQRLEGLTMFKRMEGAESCISHVSEELNKTEWAHLACHGLPNRQRPFESAFALYDGHFTIEHIMCCELQNPQFAYLSACHTTVGDKKAHDEVIHLASAMPFTGFRSVIGTVWGVDDGHASTIASEFYNHMMGKSARLDHTRAAFALNKMMKMVDIPFDQRTLYIHIGV